MDHIDMSTLWDLLCNNSASNQAPGFTEWEKAWYLTKAQDELLKNHVNPKGNKYGEGFDGNQKRQIDFSSVTKVYNQNSAANFDFALFDKRANSKSTNIPSDAWIILSEKVTVMRNTKTVELAVKPISFTDYDTLMLKPFKRPLRDQAWRLINNDGQNKADLIVGPGDVITGYSVRYIRRPKPIIIGDLDGLTIEGYSWGGINTPQNPADKKVYGDKPCELDPIMHEEIVQRAVELAMVAWNATGAEGTQLAIQAGQRSE